MLAFIKEQKIFIGGWVWRNADTMFKVGIMIRWVGPKKVKICWRNTWMVHYNTYITLGTIHNRQGLQLLWSSCYLLLATCRLKVR